MSKYKLLYLIIPIIFTPGIVTAHGGGGTYYYGNGYHGKYSRQYNNYRRPYNNLTGPVISFNRAYGPVTSFGLRNYYGTKRSDIYNRRYSYDENFNAYLRNRAVRELNRNRGQYKFGYSYEGKSGNNQYRHENRNGNGNRNRSGFYGKSD